MQYGFAAADLSDGDAIVVWPDNESAVNVFMAMSTQWRVGVAGPVGLDYGALPAVLRLAGVARSTWSDVFNGLRWLESGALAQMRDDSDGHR